MTNLPEFTISLSGVQSLGCSVSDIFIADGNTNNNLSDFFQSGTTDFKNGTTITMKKNCNLSLSSNTDSFLVIKSGVTFNGGAKTLTLSGFYQNYEGPIKCIGGTVKNLNVSVSGGNITLGSVFNGSSLISGGWICRSNTQGTIQNCSSSGPISSYCGGICGSGSGFQGNCNVINCYSSGLIGNEAGGICGIDSGKQGICTISNCYSSGNINGGGICGTGTGGSGGNCTIANCYSLGTINYNSGGITGMNTAVSNGSCTISNCYSTGAISGGGSGGICGFGTGDSGGITTVINCYSSGTVGSGSGSILGSFAQRTTVTKSYGTGIAFDNPVGITSIDGSSNLTLSLAEITDALPSEWNSSIWEISQYPKLKSFTDIPWVNYQNYNSSASFFINSNFNLINFNGTLSVPYSAQVSYLWDDSSTGNTRMVTRSGIYSVNITFEDLSITKTITILPLTVQIIQTVDNENLVLTANASGGIGSYFYLWNDLNSSTGNSITVSSADNITITITSGEETITAAATILAEISHNNGTLTVSTTGDSTYTYLWDNNVTANTRSITAPGTYSVIISTSSVSVTKSITISPINNITITNSFGTLSTNLDGNFTYLWSDGSTGATMKIRSPGTYSVKVFLPNSIGSQIFTINSTLGVSINYQSSGILTANPTGSGPYQYLWSVYDTNNNEQSYSVFKPGENPGETTNSIRPKYATREYIVTIYAENEIGTASRVIKRSTGIVHDINPGNNTLTAEINTSGISANYLWSTGATTATIQIDSNISEYSVVFYFNDGTISTRSTIILTNTIPNITISNNNFGLLTVTSSLPSGFPSDVTPNYSYSWNGDSSLTNTKHINEPGTYTVTITLENPSSSSSPYTGSKTIIIEDAGAGILNGKEGLLTVSVPEGDQTFHYEWSGGEVPENNFPSMRKITGPGTYIAIVYSSDGKISKLTKTIVPLTVSISRYANVLTVTPDNSNNEYKYKWDTNQVTTGNTKTITTNGTYSVIVYGDDSFGSASFVVAPLSVSISNDSQGNLTQSAQGGTNIGYQYTWEKDSVVITNPVVDSAGNYKVTVRDSANNEASSSITINSITPTITNNLDGTLTAGPTDYNLYNFKWNTNTNFGNTTNITNGNKDSPVTYTVTAYSSNGYGKASRTISNVSVDLTRVENKVVAPPGYTYKWSDGQNSDRVIINNAGTYSVTVYSNNSYGVGSLTIGSITPVINSSGSTLSVAGSYDYYLWSNGLNTSTITITSSGIYSVKVFSGYNFGSAAITINNLIVNINFDSDGNLRASADGATSFSWNDGSTNPIKSGININTTYTMTASSDNATGTNSVTITNARGPNDLRSIASNNPGIIGFYTADEVKAYIWNDGVRGHEREVNRSGDYSITVYFQSGNSYSIGTWTRNIPQLDFAIQNYSLPATFREFFPPDIYSNSSYKHSWSVVGAASITPDNDPNSIFYRSARPRGVGTYKLIISGIGGYGEATRTISPLTAEIKFNEIIDEDGFPIHFIRVIPSGGDDVFYFYDWKYTEPNVKTSDDRTMITLTSERGSSKSRYIVDVTCIGELRFTTVYDYNTPITRRPPGQISANLLLSSDNKTVSSNQVLSWLGNLFSNSSIGKSIQETSDAMRKARERKESKPKTKLSFSWSDINFVDPVVKSAQSLDNKGQNSFDALLDRASQLSASAKKLKEKALF